MIPIPPFLVKYGIRIMLIAGLAGSLFVGGCMYSDKQHAEHAADVERQTTVAIVEAVEAENARWQARFDEENAARIKLQSDLSAITDHRDALIEGIRNAQLTKPLDDVTIEACLETEDENVKLVVANPFTAEFVGLYNDASKAGGSPEAVGPTPD